MLDDGDGAVSAAALRAAESAPAFLEDLFFFDDEESSTSSIDRLGDAADAERADFFLDFGETDSAAAGAASSSAGSAAVSADLLFRAEVEAFSSTERAGDAADAVVFFLRVDAAALSPSADEDSVEA
ncbi:hypothetical protein, partial [Enterobacter sp. 56-7]|uniref:hypothetical protein n=1 Tax=Enterobacter sp. 56-7 TaxID=1895906 RepID=UPI00257C5129